MIGNMFRKKPAASDGMPADRFVELLAILDIELLPMKLGYRMTLVQYGIAQAIFRDVMRRLDIGSLKYRMFLKWGDEVLPLYLPPRDHP